MKQKGNKAVVGVKQKGKARPASKPVGRTKRAPSPSPASQTEKEEVVFLVQEQVEEVAVSMAVEKPKARAARAERSPTPAEDGDGHEHDDGEEDEGMTQALGTVRALCPAPTLQPSRIGGMEGRITGTSILYVRGKSTRERKAWSNLREAYSKANASSSLVEVFVRRRPRQSSVCRHACERTFDGRPQEVTLDTQMVEEEEEEEEEEGSEQIDDSKELEMLKTALQRYGQKTHAVAFKKISLVVKVRCLPASAAQTLTV
jgi:hypothetical protein